MIAFVIPLKSETMFVGAWSMRLFSWYFHCTLMHDSTGCCARFICALTFVCAFVF